MTLDTQRLLLAAQVRNIAIELQDTAAKKAVPTAGDARTEQVERYKWKQATPLANFFPQALAELQGIADLMPK